MKIHKKLLNIISLIIICCILSSCTIPRSLIPTTNFGVSTKSAVALTENKDIYNQNDDDKISNIYVTVVPKADQKFVFADLNKDNDYRDEFTPVVNVILQDGDENGPQFGNFAFGINDSNGKMKVRGKSTRLSNPKSYKITLNDKLGLWNGQKVVNLNKHALDITKMRNKLAFDYFKNISNFASMRTKFVVLHIKDLSEQTANNGFVNYGLYTYIEEPDKQYLKNHGLDANGNLYKANFFEFVKNNGYLNDVLVDVKNPAYNKDKFEQILEIKAGKDHKKLINMLDDVNDLRLDIDAVASKHFNVDNYLTWLAINIIMGNVDTSTQNFYLYCPSNSSTWYFLPWDYDGSMGFYNQTNRDAAELFSWQRGLSNYWSSFFHKRFFSKAKNVEALTKKIEELKLVINYDNTSNMLNSYYNLISKYVNENPQMIKSEIERISNEPEANVKKYYESLKYPMPVFTAGPFGNFDKRYFSCEKSFNIAGGEIYYDFVLAKDPGLKDVVEKMDASELTEFYFEKLPPGVYYYKVTIKNKAGYSQQTFDKYVDEKGTQYFGVRQVKVD